MKDNTICKQALQAWGANAQMLMVLEEMSELQKEILKNINRGKDNLAEIIDETADVYIMLEQLKLNYNIETAVEERIEFKLARIKERLNATKAA